MFSINYTLDKNSAIIKLGLFTAVCAFMFLKKGLDFIICGHKDNTFVRLKGLALTGVAALLFLGGLTAILESEKLGKFLGETVAAKVVKWLTKDQQPDKVPTKKHRRHKKES